MGSPCDTVIFLQKALKRHHSSLMKMRYGLWGVISTHLCVYSLICTCGRCHILTPWGRVTHICVGNLTIIGSDNGLFLIGPIKNKLQWNFNWNSNIFIQENAFEKVVCEMAAILSRPQCVNPLHVEFFKGNIKMHSVIYSCLHTDNTGSWILSLCKTRSYLFYIVNDVLAMQGARASVTMIRTMLNWNNLVPTH